MKPTPQTEATLVDTRAAGDAPRYTVGDELGRGGMGAVFRAVDGDLRREVALKAMLDGSALERFLREAQLTAQLEHPNIVPVHDVGLTADGAMFFTMKVVAGKTLGERLLERPPLRESLDMLLKVSDAVAFAHSRSVVHRDLKPANVMVGEFGEVLVMDWGLARVSDLPDIQAKVETTSPGRSLDGSVVGTPSYMAPEQACGETADARSDVYSLGAVLYQMLTGRPPVTGSSIEEALANAAAGSIVPPEDPPELAAVAMKAMARDPADRYPNVAAFADDVRRYLDGREVSARRDPWLVRASKWTRRHAVGVTAAAVAVVALGVGLWLQRERGEARLRNEARMEAARRFGEARALAGDAATIRDLVEADALLRSAEALTGRREPYRYELNRRLGRLAVEGADYALARLAFSVCRSIDPERARRDASPDAVAEAEQAVARSRAERIAAALGELRQGLGRPGRPPGADLLDDYVFEAIGFKDAQTVRLLSEALEPPRRKACADGREALWTQPERDVMKYAFRVLGRLDHDDAVEPLAAMLAALWDHELLVVCGRALCDTHRAAANGPLLEARERLNIDSETWRAIAPFMTRLPEEADEPADAGAFYRRGLSRYERRDYTGAAADFLQTVRLKPEHAGAWSNLGLAYAELGRLQEGLEALTRATQLDPDYLGAVVNRASCLTDLGRIEEAVAEYTRAIELAPDSAPARTGRATVMIRAGRYTEAVVDLDVALRLDPDNSTALGNRALARAELGDPAGALEDYARALDLTPDDVLLLTNRAQALTALGRHEEALADASRAIELEPGNGRAFDVRGIVRFEAGDVRGAKADFDRAIELDAGLSTAYNNRGRMWLDLGDPEAAIADFGRAYEIDPGYVQALYHRALVYGQLGRAEEALRDLAAVIERDATFGDAYFSRAQLLSRAGRPAESLPDYERAAALLPDDAVLFRYWAETCLKLEDAAGALSAFDRSIALDAGDARARRGRGEALIELKRFEEAIETLSEAVRMEPDDPYGYAYRGQAREGARDLRGAISDWEEALKRMEGEDAETLRKYLEARRNELP